MPAAAFTISLTVSGTTHDVLFTAGSYDSVNGDPATPLTTTPWFGNFSLAQDLAQALATADGAAGNVVPVTDGLYLFVYSATATDAVYNAYFGPAASIFAGSGGVGGSSGVGDTTRFTGDPYYYAAVAPVPVPEIDGNALAKALFILFALGLWLDLRRRRREG
ncbi:MAG: hypothetical protein ACE368_22110 [Paracoccaceae bacterium]